MKVAIWANTAKEEFWKLFPKLMTWFQENKQEVFLTTRIVGMLEDKSRFDFSVISSLQEFSQVDFVLAMGGDGTILSGARAVGHMQIPILGVHLGGFGFLAEGSVGNLFGRLKSIISDEYIIFSRMVLEVQVGDSDKRVFHSLNDLVIDRGESSRLMRCTLTMNERLITSYSADGLIISTPTGSTAYNLSAGGPIIAPWLSLFTVTPICPHSLSSRPIVLPSQEELAISFPHGESELRVAMDGQIQERVGSKEIIYVRRAPYDVQMITFEDRNYFHTLRTKMGWGQSDELTS
ncbi:MAG: NAD(+)/NADH kinase [Candidatus Neomarinimicrobiota bacterium]